VYKPNFTVISRINARMLDKIGTEFDEKSNNYYSVWNIGYLLRKENN